MDDIRDGFFELLEKMFEGYIVADYVMYDNAGVDYFYNLCCHSCGCIQLYKLPNSEYHCRFSTMTEIRSRPFSVYSEDDVKKIVLGLRDHLRKCSEYFRKEEKNIFREDPSNI